MAFQDTEFKGKLERAFASLQDLRYVTQFQLKEFDADLKQAETTIRGMLKFVRTDEENQRQRKTDSYT
ncbi:hypothetical protein D3C76_429740 [compost metagenome]